MNGQTQKDQSQMPDFSQNSFSLTGKRALVTGASRGIGGAVAKGLAEFGADVWLLARNADDLADMAQDIRAQGGHAETASLDLMDQAAVSAFIEDQPAFDILVNNAGMNIPTPFIDVSEADFDAIFGLNVRAPFFLAQAVSRKMVEARQAGSIINMSSQMGHVGAENRTVYCGSKHAMEGWTKAMAIELGKHNVRVNTVCPTFIETPLTEPFFKNPEFKQSVLSKIQLGRVGQISEVVGAVIFLASDAASLMTGSAVMVDGGWTAD